MFRLVDRFKRKPEPTFTATLSEIERFKHLVMTSHCPGCTQLALKIDKFAHTRDGWEAEVFCKNCEVKGVVNSNGFSFQGLEKDGKAKTK